MPEPFAFLSRCIIFLGASVLRPFDGKLDGVECRKRKKEKVILVPRGKDGPFLEMTQISERRDRVFAKKIERQAKSKNERSGC